jgi:GNAT superfamily N-acetyltransferase
VSGRPAAATRLVSLRDELLDGPGARALLPAYDADIRARYPGSDVENRPGLEAGYVKPPAGRLVVAYLGPDPVACGAVRRIDERTGEVKSVYVAPEARGRGIGRLIMGRLEQVAEEAGYERVRLDTGDKQPEALALYESLGYREIHDYNGNPYARHWLEKRLA